MRIKLLLDAGTPLIVPWDYRTTLTKAIYDVLGVADNKYSSWLHDQGYTKGKRKYKLFVYSNLRPLHFQAGEDGLYTDGSFTWQIATPDHRFVDKFLDGLARKEMTLSLFQADLKALDIITTEVPVTAPNRTFRTISPIVVSTWDGKSRQPTYRNATEPEFAMALEANLISKWEAFNQKKWEGEGVGIRVWKPKSTLVPVFNISVRAWYVNLQIWGPDEVIRFAYDAGLGEKNSQGFGMIEIGG